MAGLTQEQKLSRWTTAPYPRAPRLGPRPFSISLVNSLGGSFVWGAQLRKQTLLRLSTNDFYADFPDY